MTANEVSLHDETAQPSGGAVFAYLGGGAETAITKALNARTYRAWALGASAQSAETGAAGEIISAPAESGAQKFRYDALVSKPDMSITVIDDSAKGENRADILFNAKKNAARFGGTKTDGNAFVNVKDIWGFLCPLYFKIVLDMGYTSKRDGDAGKKISHFLPAGAKSVI